MTLPRFQVPKHGHNFPEQILSRSLDLIACSVWSGFDALQLRKWMKNFSSPEERYLAACILDNLIFRSDQQINALALHLFQRSLVDLVRLEPTPLGPINNWLSRLGSFSDPQIRIVPAILQSDETHKSGHIVSRLLKRQFGVQPNWIAKSWELRKHINDGAKIILFIDDFLGTGDQFSRLIRMESLSWIFDEAYTIYAPFAAHESGISELKRQFPKLKITAAETLGARHNLFDESTSCFDDGTNSVEAAREFYYEMLPRKGIHAFGEDRLGFGGLGLAYVFKEAVPDNNLPLLWHPANTDWVPLFNR